MKPGDIVTIKITSGEEIIGSFISQDDKGIKLRKPLMMAMTQNGPGLMPYFMSSDTMSEASEVTFNSALVVAMAKVHKPFADAYTESTSSISVA